MGKINNGTGVEIIPINENSPGESHEKRLKMPYMSDPSIVPRVQKVNKCSKYYVVG